MAEDVDAAIWNTISYDTATKLKIPKSKIEYSPVTLPEYFNHAVAETTADGTRIYTIDSKPYPSITSVIKATDKEGKAALAKWRAEIGSEAAQKISTAAAVAGTRWHTFCEKYLTKQSVDWRYFDEPKSAFLANNIAIAFEENVKTVIASEIAIKSDFYGIAGRMDLAIQLANGEYAILDFKTGRKEKYGNRLRQAAIQGCFYGDALTEHRPDIKVTKVVIMQILPKCVMWQESPMEYWRPMLKEKVREYANIING